jgi:hypothetical protein
MDARALAMMLALAGCHRVASESAPAVTAAPRVSDPGGWPSRLQFGMAEQNDGVAGGEPAAFSIETRLPEFHSEPDSIGAALNARLGKLARPAIDPRRYGGRYSLECSVELANRYAVILDCSELLEIEPLEDDDGAAVPLAVFDDSGEPRRRTFGFWLRRGLPPLSIEQFAPRFDLRAAVEAAAPSQPPDCDLHACVFDPRSFLIDGEGITLVATEDCPAVCDAVIPSIPLDRLAPSHAWASELVKRVRRRVEAGDMLVEGDRSY